MTTKKTAISKSNDVDHTEHRKRELRVGVFGASGIAGAELVRLLEGHPAARVVFGTSREHAGRDLAEVDPGAPVLELTHPDEADPSQADVVFLALPHGCCGVARRCLEAGARVVDLSGELRLEDDEAHQRFYATPRPRWMTRQAAYGLTELFREDVAGARLVSNPGCYATCAGLALGPLAGHRALGASPVIDAKSGVSGAGRAPTAVNHFCSVAGDVRPYKVGRRHRHAAEIEQTLTRLARPVVAPPVVFNPHLVPLERGILCTVTAPGCGRGADGVRRLLAEAYAREPFVEVLPEGREARVRLAARTNRAVLSVHGVDGADAVIVVGAIDNLVKGAAGQAIQNMNVMLGLQEPLGLPGARTVDDTQQPREVA